MSVLLEFSMFPTDVGESKSKYVARIIDVIEKSGLNYQLNSMSTIIESDNLKEALKVVEDAYGVLQKDCTRVYATLKLDIREGRLNGMNKKVESVKKQREKL